MASIKSDADKQEGPVAGDIGIAATPSPLPADPSGETVKFDHILVGCFRGAAAGVILFGMLALQIMLSMDIKGGDLYLNLFSLQIFVGAGVVAGGFILRDEPAKKPLPNNLSGF